MQSLEVEGSELDVRRFTDNALNIQPSTSNTQHSTNAALDVESSGLEVRRLADNALNIQPPTSNAEHSTNAVLDVESSGLSQVLEELFGIHSSAMLLADLGELYFGATINDER